VPPLRIDLTGSDDDLGPLADAIARGASVIVPTDTVYGLACAASLPQACAATLALKGARPAAQPSAILCASIKALEAALPELDGRAAAQARSLLPGRVTLVVPNPRRRFRWLCGDEPAALGVRVPALEPRLAAALEPLGPLLATSANSHGGPDPLALDEVPAAMLAQVAVTVDAGRSAAGAPSTVVDLCGSQPRVLRDGALPRGEVLARLAVVGG